MSIKFDTLVLVFFSTFLQRSVVAYECHRERKFVKVIDAAGLPQISAIKVTTVTEETFCSIECVDYPGCKSFAYLNNTSIDNCLLSSAVDGASVSGKSDEVEVYKEPAGAVAQGCEPNPCLNGGTCLTTCEEPFYHCVCPEETTGEECTTIFISFSARFTNLGASGRLGPTTIANYYNGQQHKDLTTIQDGIQFFTVPHTGTYTIVTVGAAGGFDTRGSAYRGRGVMIGGDFKLGKRDVLKILVGQAGLNNSPYYSSGGGGGTFVATSSDTSLIVAGGGGGIEAPTLQQVNAHATRSTTGRSNGAKGVYTSWNGGTNGQGATEADNSNSGGGGGGFYSSGRSSTHFGGGFGVGGEGGKGFKQGGVGGRSYRNSGYGGFGGGGGAYGNGGGSAGGGGYSGGASGDNKPNSCGGGGGSYNSAFQNIHYQEAYNTGHGWVQITRIQ